MRGSMVLKPVCKIVLVCMITFLWPNKVYVALQMLDQVGVTNLDSQGLEDIIDIKYFHVGHPKRDSIKRNLSDLELSTLNWDCLKVTIRQGWGNRVIITKEDGGIERMY